MMGKNAIDEPKETIDLRSADCKNCGHYQMCKYSKKMGEFMQDFRKFFEESELSKADEGFPIKRVSVVCEYMEYVNPVHIKAPCR